MRGMIALLVHVVALPLSGGAPTAKVGLLRKQSPPSAAASAALAHVAKDGERAVENTEQPANCGQSLPDKSDPQYFQKQLEMDKCGCGEVCMTNKVGQPGKYFNFVRKTINCPALFSNLVAFQASPLTVPPVHMPQVMKASYTMENTAPVEPWYVNQYQPGNNIAHSQWTKATIETLVTQAQAGKPIATGYNGKPDGSSVKLRAFLEKHRADIEGRHCAVIGSQRPWLEALLLSVGAKQITTIEYGTIQSEDPRIRAIHPSQLPALSAAGDTIFDCVASYSSIEHAGLGRYGDVLDPWGDLRVMAQMQCVTTPDASFFIGVPFGLDRIAWNAHRYYGPRRLPQLFANVRVDDTSEPQVQQNPASVTGILQPMYFGKKVA